MFPDTRPQALIDKLVITGLSALCAKRLRPKLWGKDRDRWELPDELRDREAVGKERAN